MNVVFLPMDERFCTRDYLLMMADVFDIKVKTPGRKMLGQKKVPADLDAIWSWLEANVEEGDILILSYDMLLYGGLIPSRTSLDSVKTLRRRLDRLSKIKKGNNKLYIASTITRIPDYDYSDEEPVYWDYFGAKINKYSKLLVKLQKDLVSKMEIDSFVKDIPRWVLDDFHWRRERNFKLVKQAIDLTADGLIDYLNLTLDDNAPDSLSVYEAKLHSEYVKKLNVSDRVSIHPGADESALSLLAKAATDYFNYNPSCKITYSETEYTHLIPLYEGSPISESVPQHVESCGGIIFNEETGADANLIVHNSQELRESTFQKKAPESVYERVLRTISDGKPSGLADIAFANGADNALIEKLLSSKADFSNIVYSAWNTAGNTIGTVSAGMVLLALSKKGFLSFSPEKLLDLNAVFLLEHWGYQANIRKHIWKKAQDLGLGLFTVIPFENEAEEQVYNDLAPYRKSISRSFNRNYDSLKPWFPWHRPFEIAFRKEE